MAAHMSVTSLGFISLSSPVLSPVAIHTPVLSTVGICIPWPLYCSHMYPDSSLLQAEVSTLLFSTHELIPSPLYCRNTHISSVLYYRHRYLFFSLLQAYTFPPLYQLQASISLFLLTAGTHTLSLPSPPQECLSTILSSTGVHSHSPLSTAGVNVSSPLSTAGFVFPLFSTAGICILCPLYCRHEYPFSSIYCRNTPPLSSTTGIYFFFSLLQLHTHPF